MIWRPLTLTLLFALPAACADAADAPPSNANNDGGTGQPQPSVAEQRYATSATIIDEPNGPPVLCLGGVMESLPPQCDGTPLVGWDWNLVTDEHRTGDTAWGDYRVVGTYDGSLFTVEDVGPPQWPNDSGDERFRFDIPCEEPPGGWTAPDPSRATDDDQIAASRAATAEPDYTADWIHYLDPNPDPETPGRYVYIAGFTKDLSHHEAELRRLWGGPLCVFRQERPHDELRRIQRELGAGAVADLGFQTTWSDIDVSQNRVEVGAIVVTPAMREAIDARYGDGTVLVIPALEPVS